MKRFILAVAIAAVAMFTLAGTASADVPRYQLQKMTFNVTEPYGAVDQWTNVWTHTYTITVSPCDNTFTGTGIPQTGPGGATEPGVTGESITGTLGDGSISFTATREPDGRTWTLTDAPYNTVVLAVTSPPVSWDIDMMVTVPEAVDGAPVYKNHGDYVKQMGGGADAAHSCIGMPIPEVPFTWSMSGTVDSTSTTGTDVALPKAGTYRIDVLGDWRGDSNTNNRVDAEYLTSDSWSTVRSPNIDQGDLQVNGAFVDWGAYSSSHTYTLAMPLSGTVNLAVFDGDASTNTKNPSWYTDNAGTLSFSITYVGP